MKLSRRVALFAALIALLSTPNVNAQAVTLTDAQIERIRLNCVAAQSSMQRLEQNEAVSRRNRGVSYESTLKLMAALNGRIVFNKLSRPNLTQITSQIEEKRAEFISSYIAYNNSFNIAMRLPNCQEQPVTFYDYLTQTRELRATLVLAIDDIDQLLNAYQLELNELKQSITPPPGAPQ